MISLVERVTNRMWPSI